MFGPDTIKSYKRVDLSESKSLVSDKGFSPETLRLLIKSLSPSDVDWTGRTLAALFKMHGLRVKGPVPHRKYRGSLKIRNPKTGILEKEIHGCLIHTRELRVYQPTQSVMDELIQWQCPASVSIEVRKGLVNVERTNQQ